MSKPVRIEFLGCPGDIGRNSMAAEFDKKHLMLTLRLELLTTEQWNEN